jgi:hypothetical protein
MSKLKKFINIKDIFIFFIMFFILLGLLILLRPGFLTFDSFNQLEQIYNNSFTNWHPFFHTFVEMLLLKIGGTLTVISLFQILVLSIMWTVICHYYRNDSKYNFPLQIVITLCLVLNPLNFMYSMTFWKDILFSYSVLFLTFLLAIMCRKDFVVSKKMIVLLSIFLALVYGFRLNGKYVFIIMLPILVFILFKKDKKSYNYLLLIIVSLSLVLGIKSLDYIYKVKNNEKDAIEPKILQLSAFYNNEGVLEEKDLELIDKAISIETLMEVYSPTYSDSIWDNTDHKVYKENHIEIYKMILKTTVKHPIKFVKYVFESTNFVWNPTYYKNGTILIISTYTDLGRVSPANYDTEYYNLVIKIVNKSIRTKAIASILYNPALYMYISIILLIVLKKRVNKKINLLFILPNLLNILIVAASNPVQDVRYLYPNNLILYFVTIIFIYYLFNNKKTIK